MQIAWSQRTLQEENSLGRVTTVAAAGLISSFRRQSLQAVVPFTNAGPRVVPGTFAEHSLRWVKKGENKPRHNDLSGSFLSLAV